MNHQELYKLLITVQKNVRCPQCGKSYDFSVIQIRGIVDSLVFLELSCGNHMPLLATVSLSTSATTKKSVVKLTGVTPDDVIETYKLMKKFNGNFEQLFNETKTNKE